MGNYRDLEVYQLSKQLAKEVIIAIDSITNKFWMRDQISRSAFSIPSNIAEAEGRLSDKQSLQFLKYALGSTFELITQLEILLEIQWIEKNPTLKLVSNANLIAIKLRKQISYRSIKSSQQ